MFSCLCEKQKITEETRNKAAIKSSFIRTKGGVRDSNQTIDICITHLFTFYQDLNLLINKGIAALNAKLEAPKSESTYWQPLLFYTANGSYAALAL